VAKIQIKQVGSVIGCKKSQRQTIRALGLHRLNDVVIKEDTPEIKGMVNKVSYLLEVSQVD